MCVCVCVCVCVPFCSCAENKPSPTRLAHDFNMSGKEGQKRERTEKMQPSLCCGIYYHAVFDFFVIVTLLSKQKEEIFLV